jgi:hypothetical protein
MKSDETVMPAPVAGMTSMWFRLNTSRASARSLLVSNKEPHKTTRLSKAAMLLIVVANTGLSRPFHAAVICVKQS